MRSLLHTIRSGNAARFNGLEAEFTGIIDRHAAKSKKWVADQFAGILRMSIPTLSVRLPDFQHRVGHGLSIAIEHATTHSEMRPGSGTSC